MLFRSSIAATVRGLGTLIFMIALVRGYLAAVRAPEPDGVDEGAGAR